MLAILNLMRLKFFTVYPDLKSHIMFKWSSYPARFSSCYAYIKSKVAACWPF